MDNHTYNKLDDILQAEYKRGREEGYAARKEADQGDNADYYKHGLEEAWELAKKVLLTKNEGGFSGEDMEKIFETANWVYIFRNFTAQEAIEKIKEYEAEQKRKKEEEKLFHVGDEVIGINDKKGYVTRIRQKGQKTYLSVLYSDGNVGYGLMSDFKKTGKRFNIDEFLKEIGGSEEE